MISITRLPEPERLTRNKERWLAAYLEARKEKPGSGPNSRQYRHREIREVLEAMSHNKCFYCEHKLSETAAEVDHYQMIADNRQELTDLEKEKLVRFGQSDNAFSSMFRGYLIEAGLFG